MNNKSSGNFKIVHGLAVFDDIQNSSNGKTARLKRNPT
jgi:hypothetical protein